MSALAGRVDARRRRHAPACRPAWADARRCGHAHGCWAAVRDARRGAVVTRERAGPRLTPSVAVSGLGAQLAVVACSAVGTERAADRLGYLAFSQKPVKGAVTSRKTTDKCLLLKMKLLLSSEREVLGKRVSVTASLTTRGVLSCLKKLERSFLSQHLPRTLLEGRFLSSSPLV